MIFWRILLAHALTAFVFELTKEEAEFWLCSTSPIATTSEIAS
jgi:hypothetical protein